MPNNQNFGLSRVFLVILFIVCLYSYSVLADQFKTANTILNITSVPPNVTDITLDDDSTGDGILFVGVGGSSTLICNATVNDPDGNLDIENITGVIYGPSSNWYDADSYYNHYSNSSCDYNVAEERASCTFTDVAFYAEPGMWTCLINATDYAINSNDTQIGTAFMSYTVAIDVQISGNMLDFGSVAVGTVSAVKSATVYNIGNVDFGVGVDVFEDNSDTTDPRGMACSRGFIPTANINASLQSNSGFRSMDSGGILDIGTTISPGDSDTIYWKLKVPNSEVAGSCSGKVFFSAQ